MGDLRWTAGCVVPAWLHDAFPGEEVLGIMGFTQHPPRASHQAVSLQPPAHRRAAQQTAHRLQSRCRSDPHPNRCGAAWPTLTLLRSLARLRDALSGGEGPCEGMG